MTDQETPAPAPPLEGTLWEARSAIGSAGSAVAGPRKEHPGAKIVVTDHVGAHPLMAKAVAELVEKSDR